MKPIILLILIVATFSVNVFSQTMEEIMDDGHVGEERVILKIIPSSFLYGEFPISAEVRVARPVSIEVGVGWIADYFLKKSFFSTIVLEESFSFPDELKVDASKSFSFQINPKLFVVGKNMNGISIGPYFHQRHFAFEGTEEKLIVTDKCLMYTYQTSITARWWLECYIAMGKQTIKYPEGYAGGTESGFTVPYGVKVGFGF